MKLDDDINAGTDFRLASEAKVSTECPHETCKNVCELVSHLFAPREKDMILSTRRQCCLWLNSIALHPTWSMSTATTCLQMTRSAVFIQAFCCMNI